MKFIDSIKFMSRSLVADNLLKNSTMTNVKLFDDSSTWIVGKDPVKRECQTKDLTEI